MHTVQPIGQAQLLMKRRTIDSSDLASYTKRIIALTDLEVRPRLNVTLRELDKILN
jgi:hypothetical protein